MANSRTLYLNELNDLFTGIVEVDSTHTFVKEETLSKDKEHISLELKTLLDDLAKEDNNILNRIQQQLSDKVLNHASWDSASGVITISADNINGTGFMTIGAGSTASSHSTGTLVHNSTLTSNT